MPTNIHKDRSPDNKSRAVAYNTAQLQNDIMAAQPIVDNRPEIVAQRAMQETVKRLQTSVYSGNINNITQRKEGDVHNGVVQIKPSDGKLAIWVKGAMQPWFVIPEGSDVKNGDSVQFTEGKDRSVTNLIVTKEMRTDIEPSKMNSTQLFNAFYNIMIQNGPAKFIEKYLCKGEDGNNTYSKEYAFRNTPEDVILHIHWEKKGQKTDVVRAHIKNKKDKYEIGKSTSLLVSELEKLGIPLEEGERIFAKFIK